MTPKDEQRLEVEASNTPTGEEEINPREVVIRLLVGKDLPQKVRLVLELLPDGTIAINDEIRDRQARGHDVLK